MDCPVCRSEMYIVHYPVSGGEVCMWECGQCDYEEDV